MADIWVVCEQHDGHLKHVSYEALTVARRLAPKLGGKIIALLLGEGVASQAEPLGHYGADEVYLVEHSTLGTYTNEGYAQAIVQLAKQMAPPGLFLMAATFQGKDLAPRLAALLDIAYLPDCVSVEIDASHAVVAERPMFAGKIMATVKGKGSASSLVTIRPKVTPVDSPDTTRQAKVTPYAISLAAEKIRVIVKEVKATSGGKVDLAEADIIVSGGRGMKGPENFALLDELAKVLGAAVGASRAVVDAGWMPHHMQVGQTGKTVTPKLYIACGISGAIQHLAGMRSSRCILAINKDKDAPIFKHADYGLVADLFQAVPLLTEAFKKIL